MAHSDTLRLNDLLPTRRSLISRLKRWDDQESWSAFFNVYWKLIYSSAMDLGLTRVEAEEVVQETIISVFKAMPSFRYDPERGSFRSWLLQLTSWRIKDQLRKRNREIMARAILSEAQSAANAIDENATFPALEARWEREWDATLLNAALDRVKKKADPRLFQLFELYVLKEWPVKKIRSFLHVGPASVYVAKHRVGAMLKKQVQYLRTKGY